MTALCQRSDGLEEIVHHLTPRDSAGRAVLTSQADPRVKHHRDEKSRLSLGEPECGDLLLDHVPENVHALRIHSFECGSVRSGRECWDAAASGPGRPLLQL